MVVVRKWQRNVQKKVCYRCKAVVLPTKPIVVVVACLFACFFVFWRSRCPWVVGSSSPYLFGTRGVEGCIFFPLTRLPTSYCCCCCLFVFWRSRWPYVVGSSSPYLSGTRGGEGCIFFFTYSSADFSACSPKAKKELLIAGLSNRWHVFIPCLGSGKYSGSGQKMSKEQLCLKKI